MPPAIHIMRERTRADFAEAVELGYIFNANYGVGHRAEEVACGEWRITAKRNFFI
jgi:hypothetical protein